MKFRDPETGGFKELYTKAADTLPVGTVVDFDGTEIPAGWEEVEETDNCSTEETFTGKYWRDGKKIYRKVIELQKYQIGKLASINLSNVNIKNVINLDGMVYDNTFEIPINFYNGDDMNYCYYNTSTKYLFYNFNWGFYASFILEYTKTTE